MNSEKTQAVKIKPLAQWLKKPLGPSDETLVKHRKIFALFLGAHVFVWLLYGAGVAWWWKAIPYTLSAVILCWGACVLSKRTWRLDKVQRILLFGYLLACALTVFAKLLPDGVPLAGAVPEIFVKRSWWNTFDSVCSLTLLAAFFLMSMSIARYVPDGRLYLGLGVVCAIAAYATTRIFFDKFLDQDILGTGDYVGFSNRNAFGHVLNLAFVFSLVVVITKSSQIPDWRFKTLFALLLLIVGACIILNNSRGGLLSLAVAVAGVVFFQLFKKSKKKMRIRQALTTATALILACVGALIAPEFLKRFDTNELSDYRYRYVVWSETLRQLSEVGFLGTGIQGFRYRYNSSPTFLPESVVTHAESSFFTLAYEQGLVMAALLLAFLILHIVMIIHQRHRSWRTATLGLGILSLVVVHGIYETLLRFTAINIIVCLFLGMLHGQRAWKSGLKNLKSIPFLKPALAVLLGCIFSWGVFLQSAHVQFLSAYESVLSRERYRLAWKKTQSFLNTSGDEFERTSDLAFAWGRKVRTSALLEDDFFQKAADISQEQLNRQPADPLAWLTLGQAQAASRTLLNKNDPVINPQAVILRLTKLTNTTQTQNFLSGLFVDSGLELIQLADNRYKPIGNTLTKSSLLEPANSRAFLSPGQIPPEEISFPFLADELVITLVIEEIKRQNLLSALFSKNTPGTGFSIEPMQETLSFIGTWARTKPDFLNPVDHPEVAALEHNSAPRSFANANKIYPEVLMFYCEALGTLAIYRPDLLDQYYKLLTEKQRETLWASWQRYLVYDARMRSPNLVKWIASTQASSQIRLQAARMTGELQPTKQIEILRSIFFDKEASLQTRMDAAEVMQTMVGPEVWENDVPDDLQGRFEIQAKRLINAFNSGKSRAQKYADEISIPNQTTPPRLIIQAAEILEKMGNTPKALQIYRTATEFTPPAQAARQRSQEVRRRITEAALEPQVYLGRLAVLSRTSDAKPEEILDYINLSLLLDLHVGAREFLKTKSPRGMNAEQMEELAYYNLRIAELDKQTESEIQLHKQLLIR